jgi:thymidylate synthase
MNFDNITECFEYFHDHIMKVGINYNNTKAIFNSSFKIINIKEKQTRTKERKFSTKYAEFEWEWYLKGDRNIDEISKIASIWKQMVVKNTNNEVNSNYGFFWNKNNQLEKIIDELKKNKYTRRAIIVHYDLNELDRYKYDTPCNVVLNFYIDNNNLNLTVFARSIDLVYGLCNDFYTFSNLLELISTEINIKQGSMHWFITNLHIYEKHFKLLSNE